MFCVVHVCTVVSQKRAHYGLLAHCYNFLLRSFEWREWAPTYLVQALLQSENSQARGCGETGLHTLEWKAFAGHVTVLTLFILRPLSTVDITSVVGELTLATPLIINPVTLQGKSTDQSDRTLHSHVIHKQEANISIGNQYKIKRIHTYNYYVSHYC